MTLTQESLEKTSGIERLELAATELYKALQAGRDTGEYRAFVALSASSNMNMQKWLLLWRDLTSTERIIHSFANAFMISCLLWSQRRCAINVAVLLILLFK